MKAKDANGNPVEPVVKWGTGLVRFVGIELEELILMVYGYFRLMVDIPSPSFSTFIQETIRHLRSS